MLLCNVIFNKNFILFSISANADISDIAYYKFVSVKFDSTKK